MMCQLASLCVSGFEIHSHTLYYFHVELLSPDLVQELVCDVFRFMKLLMQQSMYSFSVDFCFCTEDWNSTTDHLCVLSDAL